MSEGGTALDVAHRPDAERARLEPSIHLDVAGLVELDACHADVEIVGVRSASRSDHEMRSTERLPAAAEFKIKTHLTASAFGALRPGVVEKTDAFGFQNLLQFSADLRISVGDDACTHVDDRHLAAEAPEHLAELETDIAGAENQQVRRDFAELHRGLVGKVID